MKLSKANEPIATRLTVDNDQFLVGLYQRYEQGQSDEKICEWWSSIQHPDIPKDEIFHPNKTQLTHLRAEFATAVKNNRHGVALQLKEWYRLNPHLPQPSVAMLHKFLWAAKDDLEHCKKTMTRFYLLRGTDDEIFGNRDPCSPEAELNYQVSYFACLPMFTDELYRVNVSLTADLDSDKFSAKDWVRRIFYHSDLRVRDDFTLGEVMIYDLKGFTLNHLVKFNISLVKKLITAAEAALPTRIKQIHLINSPPFVDKITSVFKPFLKEKLANRIIVHTENYEQLYKYVPKASLPFEYGGDAGTIAELSERWMNDLKRNREWFIMEEKRIKRIYFEGRKSGKIFVDSGDLFGMEGSFKKLSID